jgi:fermentation-respiration switch protein FrsA (DUF1100 family)
MARPAVLVAATVVALAVLAVAALWAFQRQLVYLPDRTPVPAAASVLPGASDVVLRTEDGVELGAWYLPAGTAAEAARTPAVLVASGNGGSRDLRASLARSLARRGLSVLLFDYRGYGGNPGSPSEQGLALDVRAARHYLLEDAGVPPDRLLYFGESLGAAVVTELATEHPPAALVLRSPFEDLASVGSVHYPWLPVRALLKDEFPVAQQVAHVDVPTTVVYGTSDTIVPPSRAGGWPRPRPGCTAWWRSRGPTTTTRSWSGVRRSCRPSSRLQRRAGQAEAATGAASGVRHQHPPRSSDSRS